MRLWLSLLLILPLSVAARAQVYSPRVTGEHNADTTDLARFRNFRAWADKKDNDLAIAVWQYLCDYETGLYHFYEVLDGPDPFAEYATMREPLKMLNVYNMGYCGIFGPTVEGIFYGCGFTTGRSFGLPGWSHCATEIYYGNAWHYFDVDVRGALVKPDGTVAGLREARTDRQLWLDSIGRVRPFFPHHATPAEAAKVADIYARSTVDFQYRWFQGSHTADYVLRPGETFTRWWQPQGGRWNHRPGYTKEAWVRQLLLTPPVGMKPNHREFTRWNHGNGLFHYAPDLASADFAAGVWAVQGLKTGKEGLELAAERGEAVFEVFTPFVIVARINDLDNPDDDAEASVISLDVAAPVTVAVSLDSGLSWREVRALGPGKHAIDLTPQVKGTYGYLVRLSASGTAGAAAIRSMSIDTWVQVAPISLPRLKKGTNRLRYDAGDRYDGTTRPVLVLPNVADPQDLKKYALQMPTNYDPTRNLARIQGDVVIRMAAPPGTGISWFSVGGTFNTHQDDGAKNTDNRIAYTVGEPGAFTEIYKADVPTWVNHWRYNYDTDVRLDRPADAVYVKYTGNPGVSVIRGCLHVIPARKQDPAVRIAHGYRIGDKAVEKVVDMRAPGDYTVECDGDVENVFVRIEKPSSAESAPAGQAAVPPPAAPAKEAPGEAGKPWSPPKFMARQPERDRLVRVLRAEGITDEAVLRAIASVPRHEFVPEAYSRDAYADRPLSIGYEQTISQPAVVAEMTGLLKLKPDSKVLEIGTGSGYQAAVLTYLTPHVYTIEIVKPLAAEAEKRLKRLGYDVVEVRSGDGFRGWPEKGPFDAIIITCAVEQIPPPLLEQLKPGGRIVVPVGAAWATQSLMLVEKDAQGKVRSLPLMPVRFVPFLSEEEAGKLKEGAGVPSSPAPRSEKKTP